MGSQPDACDTVLGLGLALALDGSPPPKNHHPKQEPKLDDNRSEFSLTLGLCEGPPSAARKIDAASEEQSAGSSFFTVKEEAEVERLSPRRRSVEEDEEGGARKKLRLSKEQSALLEERFREQSTLNPKQKIALAKQLNLRSRQVEVWFQNRRARTKLKQTEVDCEFLKKCCETLTDENRRLNRELQELRAIKLAAGPLYMHLPAAAITMCPSCGRVTADGSKSAAAAQKALLHQPFARSPSAAC